MTEKIGKSHPHLRARQRVSPHLLAGGDVTSVGVRSYSVPSGGSKFAQTDRVPSRTGLRGRERAALRTCLFAQCVTARLNRFDAGFALVLTHSSASFPPGPRGKSGSYALGNLEIKLTEVHVFVMEPRLCGLKASWELTASVSQNAAGDTRFKGRAAALAMRKRLALLHAVQQIHRYVCRITCVQMAVQHYGMMHGVFSDIHQTWRRRFICCTEQPMPRSHFSS
ncbi:uncharacterized protein LOC117509358 [Thalassophryne amazonica]|uniref:uncharacterized protein LOC117509358 n=1 Tax=Thalassophryne amazonica TaxID=390379 RepID=UPI0014724C47|nr:uncharacterized protein LOC117509358 [Thalassophryne amazonica]